MSAMPTLQLDPEAAYVVVGGLRGLCGSLAEHPARHGPALMMQALLMQYLLQPPPKTKTATHQPPYSTYHLPPNHRFDPISNNRTKRKPGKQKD
ncbi:polyketide synthase 2 [Penicillium freii]|nr:polyketide synthase 2 [Penicillium freii]